jgi:predicted TPR repeat methyltransferase
LTWRAALPRLGISESSLLPLADLARTLTSGGERIAALGAYRELLLASPDDEGALRALGAVLDRLGRDEDSAAVRTRLAVLAVDRLRLAPADRSAALAFELALAGLGPTPAEMPAAYTAALFDAYAPHFDARLRGDLLYRAPELLLAGLLRALGTRRDPGPLDVCDVGCGTGLLGPLLRPLARRLDGVDRSPLMLARAGALLLYDDLAAADLTATLASRPAAYDVVTAADVFVYIGDLAPALAATALALRCGGLAAFTVELAAETAGAGYHLTATGRYEHAPAFVRAAAAAAGLTEVSADPGILRSEQGQPVLGMVWVLRKDAPVGVA